MSDHDVAIVIDAGTGYTKVGMSNDEAPLSIFETVVGRARKGLSVDQESQLSHSTYVGREALDRRSLLLVKRPIEHGMVTNWEDWKEVLTYSLESRLCVDPSDHPVVLSQPTLNPRLNEEKMTQVMFEEFNIPALFVGSDSVFSFQSHTIGSHSKTNVDDENVGILVDIGDGGANAAPIYFGRYLAFCVPRSSVSARAVLYKFAKLVSTPDNSFDTHTELDLLPKTMAENCFVSQDFFGDKQRPDSDFERTCSLENGRSITMRKARFECMELLFKNGSELPSVANVVHTAIQRCEATCRSQMMGNIVLAGGLASVPGMADRIQQELIFLEKERVERYSGDNPLLQQACTPRVHVHPHSRYAAWLGARMQANAETFLTQCMSKEDYDENGPAFARRMFPCG